MNFSVPWSRHAETRLARLWLQSSDRVGVTRAAAEIDERLRRDASNVGESRFDDCRITHVAPLGAVFSVDVDNRAVLVLDVWRYEKRDR